MLQLFCGFTRADNVTIKKRFAVEVSIIFCRHDHIQTITRLLDRKSANTAVIRIFVDETLPHRIHKNAEGHIAWRIERNRHETFVHIDGCTTHTDSHLDASAGITRITDRDVAAQQFRCVFLQHFLVHDETTSTQDHTFARTHETLFHIDTDDYAMHVAVFIRNQAQGACVVMHMDIFPLFNIFCENFHQQWTTVIAFHLQVVAARYRLGNITERPGFFATRVEQAVIRQCNNRAFVEKTILEWHTVRH